MTAPSPTAIRLVSRSANVKPPKPPFGLPVWSATGDAVGVFLEVPRGGLREIQAIAEQVPHASTLPSGTAVVVLGAARSDNRLWRLMGHTAPVPRALRCSALLVRGYVDIGAGPDEPTGRDLAWGSVP